MSTVIQLLQNLIGQYTPVIYTDYIVDPVSQTVEAIERVPDGLAGVNMEYVASAILVIIAFYSMFQLFLSFVRALLRR